MVRFSVADYEHRNPGVMTSIAELTVVSETDSLPVAYHMICQIPGVKASTCDVI